MVPPAKDSSDEKEFRNELQAKNLLNSDTIHLLFANLPQLVEFQRRFLIGVEVLGTLPEEKQQFGSLFTRMVCQYLIPSLISRRKDSKYTNHSVQTLPMRMNWLSKKRRMVH